MLMIGLRSLLDVWAAHAGPFAMVYPTVLIATLYGHWRGGLTAFVICFFWAWYFVLSPAESFSFDHPADALRVTINAVCCLIVLGFAEGFRLAVRAAVTERNVEIARHAMLLEELEHRTKNNFALATSLLEMQKRRADHPAVEDALDQALARIHSFAAAYTNLAQSQGEGGVVMMRSYLHEVVKRLQAGAFDENVQIDLLADDIALPREVAVALGLFTNEALTNCAKYAFPDGRDGKVTVSFAGPQDGWTLVIEDNGKGVADGVAEPSPASGLGRKLLGAFAGQAGGKYEFSPSPHGCKVQLSNA